MMLFCKKKLTKDFMDCKNTKYSSELVNAHEIEDISLKKKNWLSRNEIPPVLTSATPIIIFSNNYPPENLWHIHLWNFLETHYPYVI